MVEVSTFRGAHTPDESDGGVADEHGRILRDNVFGNQEQDATRRDFTLNALFYDPATQEVWDYHGGVADLKKRRLRLIGDPEQRYREDPIRMLRAVRIAASRGLEIDAATRRPIHRLAGLLAHVPPSRLLDEMLKLLLSGHAAEAVAQLRKEGLHHGVLPLLDVAMGRAAGERFVMAALAQHRRARPRRQAGVAGLSVRGAAVARGPGRVEGAGGEEHAADPGAVPGDGPRDEGPGGEACRFRIATVPTCGRSGRCSRGFCSGPASARTGCSNIRAFAPGYDFLLLRCESGDADRLLGEWWERFQRAGETERGEMLVSDS